MNVRATFIQVQLCVLFSLQLFAQDAIVIGDIGFEIDTIQTQLDDGNLLCGDYDGDGILDVISGNSSRLVLYHGPLNSSTPFNPQDVYLPEQAIIRAIETVDFNSDGYSDLLVQFDPTVICLLRGSDSGFELADTLINDNSGIYNLTWDDLDSDGDLDAVSWRQNENSLIIYENQDWLYFDIDSLDIEFINNTTISGIGNFDSQFGRDLVFRTVGSSDLYFLHNPLNSLELTWDTLYVPYLSNNYNKVAIADHDLDGDDDIYVLENAEIWENDLTGNVLLFLNTGDSEFLEELSLLSGNIESFRFRIDHINDDGVGDIILERSLNPTVIYISSGSTYLEIDMNLMDLEQIMDFQILDIDGDTDLDILCEEHGWIENDEGSFTNFHLLSLDPKITRLADFDLDGDLDLAVATLSSVYLFENTDPDFALVGTLVPKEDRIFNFELSDIDLDGNIDLIINTGVKDNYWGCYGSYSTYVYKNLGDYSFSTGSFVWSTAFVQSEIFISDFDSDGHQDLLLGGAFPDNCTDTQCEDGSGSFGIFLGNSSTSFVQGIVQTTPAIRSIDVGDFDLDGDEDVLVSSYYYDLASEACYYAQGFSELYENEWPNWNTHSITDIPLSAEAHYHTRFRDCDGDNDLDIVTLGVVDSYSPNQRIVEIFEYTDDSLYTKVSVDSSTLPDFGNIQSDIDLDYESGTEFFVLGGGSAGSYYVYKSIDLGFIFQYEGQSQIFRNKKDFVDGDIDGDGDVDFIMSGASFSGGKKGPFVLYNKRGEGCTDSLACNFDSNSWIEDGSCCYTECGCMDPIAENYDPLATCPSNTCEYIYGCTVQGAENYDPNATMEDGSCGFLLSGIVYYDEDEDGVKDSLEYGLPYQQVYSLPDSTLYITDDDGCFYLNASGAEIYTYSVVSNPLFPFHTTPQTLTFDASVDNWNQPIAFGMSDEVSAFGICIDFYPPGNGYPCDVLRNHNICFRNMGNVPIDGYITVTYDSLFQGHVEVDPIDSISGNTVYMSYENLLPGQMFFYDIKLHTPTVDHIGEFLESHVEIFGYYEGQEVAYGERTLEMEVTCAYDPNDKQAYPFGYTEEHFIHNDTTIEYLIRFQNTGNAPATDVLIRDTIDDNLDLSSFQLVANSHSVLTSIDPASREVVFAFNDIMLPDSVNNEPESHGLVSYKIRPLPAQPHGAVMHNEAGIYFDNNPPIITNETWHSIFHCDSMTAIPSLDSVTLCLGEEVLLETSTEYVEDTEWYLYGTLLSDSAQLSFSFADQAFEAAFSLQVSNPLCEREVTIPLVVEETLFADIIAEETSFCAGDSILLTTSLGPGENAMWTSNGDTLSYASALHVNDQGSYTLQLEDGTCLSLPSSITITQSPFPDSPEIIWSEGQLSVTAQSGTSYQWYLDGELIAGEVLPQISPEQDGSYSVAITNSFGCSTSSEVFVWVTGLEEWQGNIIRLFPNPMTDRAVLDLGDLRGEIHLEIIDMSGKLVRSETQNSEQGTLTLERAGLALGQYILRLSHLGEHYELRMGVE